jgi:hypothetical protein
MQTPRTQIRRCPHRRASRRTFLPVVSQHDLFYFENLPKNSPLQPQNLRARYGPDWGVRFNFTLFYPTVKRPGSVEKTGFVE